MEDIEIIKRIKRGDIEAYSVLVEKYHRQLLNFIYRLTGDEKSVEDIGQEVFLSVYQSLQRFDESPRNTILRLAVYHCQKPLHQPNQGTARQNKHFNR